MHQIDNEYRDKRVVVMGLGRFGGGLGITRWLVEAGAEVLVTDQADPKTLTKSIRSLDDLQSTGRISIQTGPHLDLYLDDTDVLLVNPAVPQPWNNPFIHEAQSRGIDITTEIEIAYRKLHPSRIIAFTGSAGKSTTSAMTHEILNAAGHRAILGGNIGGSLLNNDLNDNPYIVLELSSAMIYWLWGHDKNKSQVQAPAVACVTNYAPNHLDWHGDEVNYIECKRLLLDILPCTSTAIIHHSIDEWGSDLKASTRIIRDEHAISNRILPGHHNAINAAMAVQAAMAITQSSNESSTLFVDAVRKFTGLPHRLNLCHNTNEIRFYNDSKSTIPQATLLAIESIAEHSPKHSIHLICGGYDKGSDLSPIANLSSDLAGIYTIGDTARTITNASVANTITCETLDKAVNSALQRTKPGDSIVLSPGCASWDQYDNYEQRGEHFTQLARQLTDAKSCSHN